MCGILSVLLADGDADCGPELFDGLTVLQHRGQDAAGIVTTKTRYAWEAAKMHCHKDTGKVADVFGPKDMAQLEGNVGIAHCRYPTAGSSSCHEAQPMYINYPCGLMLAHNGNLTNADEERKVLSQELRHLNTSSDSEVLLNIFGEELRRNLQASPKANVADALGPDAIMKAVRGTLARCRGGYAVVMIIHNVGVLAFRDPWGIRPLCLGKRDSRTMQGGLDYAAASESVALDMLGFSLIGDVAPGEAVLMLPMVDGKPRPNFGLIREVCHESPVRVPCIFEYVYFARPDSIIDGIQVYESRLSMGEFLAKKIKRVHGTDHGIDVVVPVPDTSRPTALQCAYELGVPFREGFIKNNYIGRTFIMPGQAKRRKGVRMKLNTIRCEFEGRNVLLVDDSIVRGTTTRELVAMAKEAGAKNVYVTSAAPEVRYPNVYGIDIPTRKELIANSRTLEEIAEHIGAKWVVYQDLADLVASVRKLSTTEVVKDFETSVFCGKYVTGDISHDYLNSLEQSRPSTRSETCATSPKATSP